MATQMTALRKTERGAGHVELCDVPVPVPEAGEALIAVSHAGVCGSDLHILEDNIAIPIRVPVTMGHEISGTVSAVGADVDPSWIGRRVTALPSVRRCGRCRWCKAGDINLCAERESMGYSHDGAFAPWCVVPEVCLRSLPDGISSPAAALTEPLACAIHAVEEVGQLQAGQSVAIVGPGPIGLLCLQVCVAAGAAIVLVAGTQADASRLRLARSLGAVSIADDVETAADVVNTATHGEGADVVLECSGNPKGADLALSLVRRQGTYIQVGLFGQAPRLTLDTTVVARELTLRGTFGQRPSSWDRALALLAAGGVDPGALITDVLPLRQWQQAFDRCRQGTGGKVVFDLQDGEQERT